MYKKPIGTDGLIAVMFDDDWFLRQPCQREREKCRPSEMHNVSRADQMPEFRQTRPAHHKKGQRLIYEISCWRLRRHGNIEFAFPMRVD